MPSRRAATASGSTPRVAWMAPSSDSSPDDDHVVEGRCGTAPEARQDAERDRQVEGGAHLAQVGRREVDGDARGRVVQAAVPDRALHPVAALAHRGIRQADHGEHRQAVRHVHLDEHDLRVNADDGCTAKASQHGRSRCKAVAGGTRRAWDARRRSSGRDHGVRGWRVAREREVGAITAYRERRGSGEIHHAPCCGRTTLPPRRRGAADGQGVADDDPGTPEAVPRLQIADADAVPAGDLGQRIARTDAVRHALAPRRGSR